MREDIDIKIIVGRQIGEAGAAFLDAWGRVERGETVWRRIFAFERWGIIRQSAEMSHDE